MQSQKYKIATVVYAYKHDQGSSEMTLSSRDQISRAGRMVEEMSLSTPFCPSLKLEINSAGFKLTWRFMVLTNQL